MRVVPRGGWTDEYSYDESIAILEDLALDHAEQSGPFRSDLENIIGRRDWAALLDYKLDYGAMEYIPLHLYHARSAIGLFKKFEKLRLPGVDKKASALKKFMETETRCRETNIRFRNLWRSDPIFWISPVGRALLRAQRKIPRILGRVPDLSTLKFCFGPGATTSVQKAAANPRVKLGAAPTCSSNFAAAPASFLREVPLYLEYHSTNETADSWQVELEVVPGKLHFVPKDAKTYRTIIVEPTLNGLFQQGIGRYIKKRLLKYGVDLRDQSRNQRLACLGSETNHLATFDFSSASDLISKELVAWFLPAEWYEILSTLRTAQVSYENAPPITLQKFSSMGNAFTFELESLLYYSLTTAVCEVLGLPTEEVSVFGDDVIAPSEAKDLLLEVFDFCGFKVNTEKSFWSGPFRESCGKDYYKGYDIRPYHQSDPVSARTLFTMHNEYVRGFEFSFAEKVLKYIHPSLIIFGPDGYGDGHLIGSWAPRVPKKIRKAGWGGCVFHTYRLIPREQPIRLAFPSDRLLPAYTTYVRGHGDDEAVEYTSIIETGVRVPQPNDMQSCEFLLHQLQGDKYAFMPKGCLVLPDTRGYEKISVYTLATHVFPRTKVHGL